MESEISKELLNDNKTLVRVCVQCTGCYEPMYKICPHCNFERIPEVVIKFKVSDKFCGKYKISWRLVYDEEIYPIKHQDLTETEFEALYRFFYPDLKKHHSCSVTFTFIKKPIEIVKIEWVTGKLVYKKQAITKDESFAMEKYFDAIVLGSKTRN